MRQDQLEHSIRTACQIIGRHEMVVGSQSILGTFREDQLPADATRSVEIDILPSCTRHSRLASVDERYRPAAEVATSWLRCYEQLN
jgi:hypothetical protein